MHEQMLENIAFHLSFLEILDCIPLKITIEPHLPSVWQEENEP